MVGIQTVRKVENRSKSREEFFSIKYCDRLPYMGFRYLYEALDQFSTKAFALLGIEQFHVYVTNWCEHLPFANVAWARIPEVMFNVG